MRFGWRSSPCIGSHGNSWRCGIGTGWGRNASGDGRGGCLRCLRALRRGPSALFFVGTPLRCDSAHRHRRRRRHRGMRCPAWARSRVPRDGLRWRAAPVPSVRGGSRPPPKQEDNEAQVAETLLPH